MRFNDLPCGCRTCGCLCAEHSPINVETPCNTHMLPDVIRCIALEVVTLVALALVVASIGTWSIVLDKGFPPM